jgi:hypothetical protein
VWVRMRLEPNDELMMARAYGYNDGLAITQMMLEGLESEVQKVAGPVHPNGPSPPCIRNRVKCQELTPNAIHDIQLRQTTAER